MFSTQYSDYTMDHHKYSPDKIHTVSDFSMAFSMHLPLLQQIPTNLCHFIPPRHLEQQITLKFQLNQTTRYKTFTICYAIHRKFGLVGSTICPGFFFKRQQQPTAIIGGNKWTYRCPGKGTMWAPYRWIFYKKSYLLTGVWALRILYI